MSCFSPATLTERPEPRGVVRILPSGRRQGFRSVVDAAVELQLSKSSVRKACRDSSRIDGAWFKYRDVKDPAGTPSPPDPSSSTQPDVISASLRDLDLVDRDGVGELVWTVTCRPVEGREEEVRLYCQELGGGLITTIRIDTGAMNCDQFCAAGGETPLACTRT